MIMSKHKPNIYIFGFHTWTTPAAEVKKYLPDGEVGYASMMALQDLAALFFSVPSLRCRSATVAFNSVSHVCWASSWDSNVLIFATCALNPPTAASNVEILGKSQG